MSAMSRTTVVLPLDPVTRAMGTSRTRPQSTVSGSGREPTGQTTAPRTRSSGDEIGIGEEVETAGAGGVAKREEPGIPLGSDLRSQTGGRGIEFFGAVSRAPLRAPTPRPTRSHRSRHRAHRAAR